MREAPALAERALIRPAQVHGALPPAPEPERLSP